MALEELVLLWLGNTNPARAPYRELFDDLLEVNQEPLRSVAGGRR